LPDFLSGKDLLDFLSGKDLPDFLTGKKLARFLSAFQAKNVVWAVSKKIEKSVALVLIMRIIHFKFLNQPRKEKRNGIFT
jgi:hypothetical protein